MTCQDFLSETIVEASLWRLTSAVKDLRQHADSTDSESVRILLKEAQEELSKLESKCASGSPRCSQEGDEAFASEEFSEEALRRAEEEDMELLQSIPLQGLLGACFDHESKVKDTRLSSGRMSSVSTMSSLGGQSSQTSATPRTGLPCDTELEPPPTQLNLRKSIMSPRPSLPGFDVDDSCMNHGPPTRLDLSECASPRPTLPCVSADLASVSAKQLSFMSSCIPPPPTPPSRSRAVTAEPEFPQFLSMYAKQSTSPQASPASSKHRSAKKVLASVVPIHEEIEQEQDCDDWELEFLRRAERA